jgi:hypothetical protein
MPGFDDMYDPSDRTHHTASTHKTDMADKPRTGSFVLPVALLRIPTKSDTFFP